jgi:uncharacterized OsmC-like protein
MAKVGPNIHIKLEEKLRFRMDINENNRNISWICDQPVEEGGTDAGPTPLEMMMASLGACVATMIAFYLQQKKIDAKDLTVDVGFVKEQNPYRVTKIDVKVNYPGETDAKLQKILERVAHTCIVHNTFENPPEINIEFPWS